MSGRPELMWPCLLAAAGPPASRLALVLHGAPLIQGPHVRPPSQNKGKPVKQPPPQNQQPRPSNTSEPPRDSNPLPRIIKPRKRRKKERKQPPGSTTPSPPVPEPLSVVAGPEDTVEPPVSPLSYSPTESVTSSCTCSYCDPSNDTWDFVPPPSSSSFSSSWDISSEIVTTANGHRDLEIKFILPPAKNVEPPLTRTSTAAPPPPWSSREE